jgi:hypothetical protein
MSRLFVVCDDCPGREITTSTQYVASFRIEVQRAVLFTSVELSIVFYDANNIMIRAFPITVSRNDSETYLGKTWTGSDADIVDIVARKLNLNYINS